MIKWYGSESTVKPLELDTTSSKTSVYIRKNITENTKEDPQTKDVIIIFSYDEGCLTKEEYQQYLKEIELLKRKEELQLIAYLNNISLK